MEIALVYPHQLFAKHPAIAAAKTCYLIEDPPYFGNDEEWPLAVHKQRLVLHRASMRAYAEELKSQGLKPSYVENANAASLDGIVPKQTKRLHLADPVDDLLLKRVKRSAGQRGIELVLHETPNFLSPRDFLVTHIAGKKKPSIAPSRSRHAPGRFHSTPWKASSGKSLAGASSCAASTSIAGWKSATQTIGTIIARCPTRSTPPPSASRRWTA